MSERVPDEKQEPKNDHRVRDWMVALGVGATIIAAAATTVYIVKNSRNSELQALRFGADDMYERQAPAFKSTIETMSKYWNMTVKTFTMTKNAVFDYFTKASAMNSPLVTGEDAEQYIYEESDDGDDYDDIVGSDF